MILNAVIIIATFFAMEFIAWASHKYIMHGLGWYFHKDHHRPAPGFFEKNDVFFLLFAVPGCLFMVYGIIGGNDWRLYTGIGITAYGLAYFLVHDVFIHRRFQWIKQIDNAYFRAIRKAHKVHHKHLNKDEGECFGMLLVPLKYYREAKHNK